MPPTFTDQPILDRSGLPRLTRRAFAPVHANCRTLARRDFNPWRGCSRLLARRRIVEDARRLGVVVARLEVWATR